ncbi:MAG: PCP reductase family protein, partial [Gemmatimonadetes bacterium]|nr:PCP reductase family protein [Gemmatimonadota bacterium]
MAFAERQLPGDGTLAAVFVCERCGTEIAMLTNPMETQLVSSLGVRIGGRAVPEQPLEHTRSALQDGRGDAFDGATPTEPEPARDVVHASPAPASRRVPWDDAAIERLQRVPTFVRGMVKRIYGDWAAQHGVEVITPAVMDRARSELGLEGM